MNALELAQQVIARRRFIKKLGPQIEDLPPDKKATEYVIAEYGQGRVEPWLAAYLLGCIADQSGYDTVRNILLRREGKRYAGSALAKIGGNGAYEDLLDIMFNCENGLVRREAAYGVARLASDRTAGDFKEAYQRRLLLRQFAAYQIAKCGPDGDFLLALLHSDYARDQKLALAVIEDLISENQLMPPGKRVAATVSHLLQNEAVQTNPSRRQIILRWTESIEET